MLISFTRSAIEDLEGIKYYYQDQGVANNGDEFVSAIMKRIETLASHPDIGRIVAELEDNHIRELIHPPFRVVYFRESDSIKIIRVWRSERLLDLPDAEV